MLFFSPTAYSCLYPNVAKAIKNTYSRHLGLPVYRLPQSPDNAEDGILMAFPKGENFMQRRALNYVDKSSGYSL